GPTATCQHGRAGLGTTRCRMGGGMAMSSVLDDVFEISTRETDDGVGGSAASHRGTADCCDVYNPSDPADQKVLRDRLLEVAGLSEIFKVLGDETRTRILYLLSLQEMCVCDIAEVLEMSLPAVSH